MEIDEFEFFEFPNETLIKIFSYLDDCTLLKSTQVSKRFAEVAQNAVADKYDGSSKKNVYIFEEYGGDGEPERRQHFPFLRRFCDRIIAVEAHFIGAHVRRDHWIFELIRTYCPSVTKVHFLASKLNDEGSYRIDLHDIIPNLPKLAHLSLDSIVFIDSRWTEHQYSSLVEFEINCLQELEDYALKRFFDNNPQLETFIHDSTSFTIDAFDRTNLKRIQVKTSTGNECTVGELKKISMKNLVEIHLPPCSDELTEAIAAGCKNIERIIICIEEDYDEITDRQFEALLKFEKLKALTLKSLKFTTDEVKQLISKLPKLLELEFAFGDYEFELKDIESIIVATKKHSSLEIIRIELRDHLYPIKLLANAQLHKFFINSAKNELKMVLHGYFEEKQFNVVITKEKLTSSGEVIRWVGYETVPFYDTSAQMNLLHLNNNCLNKIIAKIGHNSNDLFALYQTCSKMQQVIQPMFREKYHQKECYIQTCDSLKQIPYFGKYMSRICINIKHEDQDDLSPKDCWDPIYKYCQNHLVHLSVRQSYPGLKYLVDNGMVFPNLRRLLIGKVPDISIDKSKPLFCPRLTLLEFSRKYLHHQPLSVNFAAELNNLTTLRFWRYSDHVLDFINALNDRVHRQLHELALGNVDDWATFGNFRYPLNNSIVNAIVKFTNMKSLVLMLDGLNQANTKYLFENCSKLEQLVLYHRSMHVVRLKEVNALKSCVNLQKIQFIVDRKNVPLKEIKEYFPHINIVTRLIKSWNKTIT